VSVGNVHCGCGRVFPQSESGTLCSRLPPGPSSYVSRDCPALLDARPAPIADAVREYRLQAQPIAQGERARRILGEVERLQVAFQDIFLQGTTGHLPGEDRIAGSDRHRTPRKSVTLVENVVSVLK